jgi:Tfp pilus assembly protein PilW
MFSLIELIITALSAVILLVVVIGLVLMVAHVYRLTQRVRSMEEKLRETQQEPGPNFDPKDRM